MGYAYTGNWNKGDPCYVVAESLATLYPTVIWKAELTSVKTGYITGYITFPSDVLKVLTGSLLFFIVKCKREEIN